MSDDDRIFIRASSLSAFPDCGRRTAAKIFRKDIEAAGYRLRELPPGVGAATGTGCHGGAAYMLEHKMEHGDLGNRTEADERALEAFQHEIDSGVLWDDTSPDLNTAQKQIIRQVDAYRRHVAPTVEPVAVEEAFECAFDHEIVVTGHVDARELRRLRDLKTGVQRRANGFQYGTHSLLARGNGIDIDTLVEDYIPRKRLTVEQPKPEPHTYDIEEAERAAHSLIQTMANNLREFRQTADPWAFLANPMSMLCSDRFCPAWGTEFCKSHKRNNDG